MCNKIRQNSEDLHRSVNQYFPNVSKACMGKQSVQSAKQINGFHGREFKKFIDKVPDSTLKLKKLALTEFGCSIKEHGHLSLKPIKILLPLMETDFSS